MIGVEILRSVFKVNKVCSLQTIFLTIERKIIFNYFISGVDWGGVRREWFELICAALFDSGNGLFASFGESQQALVHPNSKRPSQLKLKHYEFAGRIVGKCLYESALGGSYRQLVRARFTRSFLAQIIGLRVHYKVNYFLFIYR